MRARPPLPVIPVAMETPPRRPRAPDHPRTPQTPPSLSRSPRYSPPTHPLPPRRFFHPEHPHPPPPPPPPVLKPPFARVHQEPVSIRGRVRGPTYSTGSATDNESAITLSFPLPAPFPALLSLSLSLSLSLFLSLSVSRAIPTWRLYFARLSRTPIFPTFLPSLVPPRPHPSIRNHASLYLGCFRCPSPFTRETWPRRSRPCSLNARSRKHFLPTNFCAARLVPLIEIRVRSSTVCKVCRLYRVIFLCRTKSMQRDDDSMYI